MDTFFLVWNPNRESPTYKHPTCESAKKEAKRLCGNNPGQTFYVLEALGCYETKPVVRPEWNEAINLPF